MKFTSIVPCSISSSTPLISYLAQRFTYHTHQVWIDLVSNGQIAVDGRIATVSDSIYPGATISYDPGEFEEPPANLDYAVIYEDEWFIGIAKPGNLLVHRAGKSFRNNLIFQLRHNHVPPYSDAHSVHRLDRDTSGIVMVAKNREAKSKLANLFSENAVEKEYIAVVSGVFNDSIRRIELPIGRKADSAIPYKHHVDELNGKAAITDVISCSQLGKKHSLVRLKPLTGRTHQIRVHLAASGYPIIGDKLYGMSEEQYLWWRENPEERSQGFQFYRHALHCHLVWFVHPYYHRVCKVECPLPSDMSDLVKCLGEESCEKENGA